MKSWSLVITLAFLPSFGFAQPTSWHDYVVPETGAVAQIPTTIISEDGGKSEIGYGETIRHIGQAR